jgi:sugar lactone lactonase YvrE
MAGLMGFLVADMWPPEFQALTVHVRLSSLFGRRGFHHPHCQARTHGQASLPHLDTARGLWKVRESQMDSGSDTARLRKWISLTILLGLVASLLFMLPGALERGHAAWLYAYGPEPTLEDLLGLPVVAHSLSSPRALVLGPDDTLYVALMDRGQVWALSHEGASMVVDGLGAPAGLALGPEGDLWVSDYASGEVVHWTASGEISLWAGGLDGPKGLAFDEDGTLVVAEFAGGRLTALPSPGEKRVIAEDLDTPAAVAVDDQGRHIIACTRARQVLRLEHDGTRTVLADGLGGPSGLAMLSNGDLAVADVGFGDLQIVRADGTEGPVFRSHSGGYIDVIEENDQVLLVSHYQAGAVVRLDLGADEL